MTFWQCVNTRAIRSVAEAVVVFAKSCVSDAVFVGTDRGDYCGRDVESALEDATISMFAPYVTTAVSNGELDVFYCPS